MNRPRRSPLPSLRCLLAGLPLAACLLTPLATAGGAGEPGRLPAPPRAPAADETGLAQGPGPVQPDLFHPDRAVRQPALGGRVTMHVSSQPPMLNFALDNSAVVRWILLDVHAALLRFDKETWDYEMDLATRVDTEDTLILKGGRGEGTDNTVFGRVSDAGDAWLVESGSPHNDVQPRRIPKDQVHSVERGTVFTFEVRQGVLWQDGHPFDASDCYFSWQIYANPTVDCDEKRYKYHGDMVHAELLDNYTVRYFYREQYFGARDAFGFDFTILPSHLFNLTDPDNADYAFAGQPEPSPTRVAEVLVGEKQGTYINENPANLMWVGLGPYRITAFERDQYVSAERFDGYWESDPAQIGYMDELVWRVISNDNTAFQALLDGELDIFYRVKTEDYKGAATQQEAFTRNFYKAHVFVGNIGYTSWNLYRPQFADVEVRQALAHAFDVRDWIKVNYLNLAVPVTGTMFRMGPGYNTEVQPLAYDPDRAEELLAEAGWYDRDGNGVVDKDGADLVIEALMPSGNKASERFLQKLQDSYARIGVQVDITSLEWAQFLERILDRQFDACNLAWTLPTPESDPYQLWHGIEAAPDKRTSNHAGLNDPVVNELIDRGRKVLDKAERVKIWHQLHARIYELQPYLFGWNVPRKIAVNKKLRGVKLYPFEPGFSLRDMYYEAGTPGTRQLARD